MSGLPSREESLIAFLDAMAFDDLKVKEAMERTTDGFLSHKEMMERLGYQYRITKSQLREARWEPVHVIPIDRRRAKPQWPTAVIEGVEMQLAPCPKDACGYCAHVAIGDTDE